MNISYTIGILLFIFILIRPSLHTSLNNNGLTEDDADYEEYDDDDDFNLEEILNETDPPTTTTTTTPMPSYIASTTERKLTDRVWDSFTSIFMDTPTANYVCPTNCICNDNFKIVNCSSQKLEQVPSDLPDIVEKLDLSSNLIEKLGNDDFNRYTKLKELILDSNQLTSVDFKTISGLKNLEYLSLVNNQLASVDRNAFSSLAVLKTLNLSRNPLEYSSATKAEANDQSNSEFLNQPKLQELILNGCKIRGIGKDLLNNLNGLKVLDLANNVFNEQIDTKAFEPMNDLVILKLPELEQNTIADLCKILTAIDTISFPKFDISCFELVAGTSFEESIIPRDSSAGNGNELLNNDDTGKGGQKSVSSRDDMNSQQPSKNGEKSITTRKPVQRPSEMEATGRNATEASNQQQSGDSEEEYKVAISSHTINYILIGIIIFAVAGIIIGIICRRDICGIKTKMCRTRRPPPTDQVRPAEEIPLNKV